MQTHQLHWRAPKIVDVGVLTPSNRDRFLPWQPHSCSPHSVPSLLSLAAISDCDGHFRFVCASHHRFACSYKQAQQFYMFFNEESSGEQTGDESAVSLFSTASVFLLSPLLLLPSSLSSLSRFGSSSSSFLSKALSPVWAILRHQSVLPAVGIIPPTDRTAASLQPCCLQNRKKKTRKDVFI